MKNEDFYRVRRDLLAQLAQHQRDAVLTKLAINGLCDRVGRDAHFLISSEDLALLVPADQETPDETIVEASAG